MKHHFPLLEKHPDLIYLDTAATSQKPKIVLDAQREFYEMYNANIHRGIYPLSVQASKKIDDARNTIASFLQTRSDHIIFTKNTTESLNLLSRSIPFSETDNIVTTEIEHHSNFVPWQETANRTKAELRIARYDKNTHNIQNIVDLVDTNTKLVSFTGMSNVSGQIFDVKNIASEIKEKNPQTIIIVDACQWSVHEDIDVNELDIDYLTCSVHKMYGPLGIGILYAKNLDNLDPFLFGGDMIESVKLDRSTYQKGPAKFEAGTIDMAGIYASAVALKFLKQHRSDQEELTTHLVSELRSIPGMKVIGHHGEKVGCIVSFYHEKIPAYDIATFCAAKNICLRVGQHCAEPFLDALEVKATLRISLGVYSTKEDIVKAIETIKETISRLKG